MPREHPLRRVERELKVAPGRRLDLIEEVDADARGLQAELERRGRTPGQARRAAVRQVVPTEQALGDLEIRHAPRFGRWMRATGRVDRAVGLGMAAVAASAGLVAVVAMYGSGVPDDAGLVTWPLVVVIAALAANLSWGAIQLWIHGDLRPPQRRLLWNRHAGLIVVAVALGASGAAWVGRVTLLGELPVWEAIGRIATVAGTGLAAAVFGLFGWLALVPRLVTDEEAEHRIAAFFAQARPHLTLSPESPSEHERKGGP